MEWFGNKNPQLHEAGGTLWASFEQQTDEKKLVKIIKLENNSLECGKP